MPKRKPRTTLPPPIPTRSNGTLNTPPEGPHADIFTDLETGNAASAAEREKRELERAEQVLHELTLAGIRKNSQPASVPATPKAKKVKPRTTTKPEIDWQPFQPLIKQAAKDAGRNNQLFCEFLDRDRVPVPPTWKVADWKAAWKKQFYTKISAFKSNRRVHSA
jgi:hypothetical protein